MEKEQSSAKRRALRILGNRSLSAQELKKRLISKGESEETAQLTVDWLCEIGLVNDEEYARAIVKHYIGKGYGMARVKNELFRRGIPRDMWDDATGELDIADVDDAAYEFFKNKLKGSTEAGDMKRASDALLRRGFSYEEAGLARKRYLEEHEVNFERTDDIG